MEENFDFLKNQPEDIRKLFEENNNDDELNLNELLKEIGLDLQSLERDFENQTPKLKLGYSKLSDDVVEPKYNYGSDSGFDLCSTIDIEIPAFGRALVPTGLCFDIEDGYEIQVRSKSGLAINQGLMVLNSPGTVDSGYNSEVKAIIFNTNNHSVKINKGMKVGQAVLCPVVNGNWVNLVKLDQIKEKDRNANGFGSTGI